MPISRLLFTTAGFNRLQDELIKVKFQETRVDVNKIVDTSFLAK
jgi:hypothetical protein